MMQMLSAGGLPVLTDDRRLADRDNPRGYFELEAVKRLAKDSSCLDDAMGKAVKIIHSLVPHLPLDRAYRVIVMQRNLDEVLASQRKVLDRSGHAGAAIPADRLRSVYSMQLEQSRRWLIANSDRIQMIEVDYRSLVSNPLETAQIINAFLGGTLNEEAMAGAVDPSLYRNRG
jgi:hypothetical protein